MGKCSKKTKERAKQLYCQLGSPAAVARVKDMPTKRTIEIWAKEGAWELVVKKDAPIVLGRPRRFRNAPQLANEILMYFNSIQEEVWERLVISSKNADGHKIERYKWVQMHDRNGDPMYRLKKAPTIAGVCLFLNITKRTWRQYREGDYDSKDDKYSEVIARALLQIEEFNFQKAYEDGHSRGAIWILERQFKYTQNKAEEKPDNKKLEEYFRDD